MSEKNENRWWENYLVRYLVPSIAGMFILMWLNKNSVGSGIEVSVISNETVKAGIFEKYLPMLKLTDGKDFNTASLTGWLLLGTLYCYIASYPVLVFHAIRIRLSLCKIVIISLFILVPLILTCLFSEKYGINIFGMVIIFIAEICFSYFQSYHLYKTAKRKGYAYMEYLAKVKNREKDVNYIKEITDSYKHLREHGNTALIILLEISLASIFYFSMRFERENGYMDFSIVSIILIIWIFPATLVYFYGHILERKFVRKP